MEGSCVFVAKNIDFDTKAQMESQKRNIVCLALYLKRRSKKSEKRDTITEISYDGSVTD